MTDVAGGGVRLGAVPAAQLILAASARGRGASAVLLELSFPRGRFAPSLPGDVMKSPVSDLAPSDGEEGSDRTPLLQRAPQAETGEWRRYPGGLREGGGPKVEGVQSRSSPRRLRSGSPMRAPFKPPSSRMPRSPLPGPGGERRREAGAGRRLRRDPGRCSPGSLGRCSPGGLGRCSRRARARTCWAPRAQDAGPPSVVLSWGPCGRTNWGREP